MNKMKKKKEEKIMLWEGFKKEIPWILFWILLGIMVYGYYEDKKICDDVLADPCDACYRLNETLINSINNYSTNNYIVLDDFNYSYVNVSINKSIIPLEDKNPNARSTSSFD